MNIGETIRIFRIANDYSSSELARMIGVSTAYISMLENRHKSISLQTLEKLSKALNVPSSMIYQIQEQSEEKNWNFQQTLREILKIYVG